MYKADVQQRIEAAYKLLLIDVTAREKYEHIRTLLKDINPHIDNTLARVSHAFSEYEKVSNVDVIELSSEFLPEETEEQKKRKKALLFLIQTWKQLRSEVERVRSEIVNSKKAKQNRSDQWVKSAGRIIKGAKGPFGIITLLAIIITGTILYLHSQPARTAVSPTLESSISPIQKPAIKGIIVNGKKIPLTELFVGHGPDCDSPHYHALNEISVKALDATVILDPGGCGFGKVKNVEVIDIQ